VLVFVCRFPFRLLVFFLFPAEPSREGFHLSFAGGVASLLTTRPPDVKVLSSGSSPAWLGLPGLTATPEKPFLHFFFFLAI